MQAAREIATVVSALFAYVTTVLPRVRRELRQLGPLPEEKVKNAEAVVVFATLAPHRRRAAVVRAILALQVAIDLRDELEEGEEGIDPGRLEQLESRWRREVAALPAYGAVRPYLDRAVGRCEQGQQHTHRAAGKGSASLRAWAEGLPAPSGYRWWEVAAGASSSVAAHALIAAAADAGTSAEVPAAIDAAYNPPIGALTVLLDDLVDLEQDRNAGEHNYFAYYADSAEAADRLASITTRSRRLIDPLPRARRHGAILAGVAAYYLSDPRAQTPFARPVREQLLGGLGPGARLLTAFMRLRRRKERNRPGRAGSSPEP